LRTSTVVPFIMKLFINSTARIWGIRASKTGDVAFLFLSEIFPHYKKFDSRYKSVFPLRTLLCRK
jgi:hypothetical protein